MTKSFSKFLTGIAVCSFSVMAFANSNPTSFAKDGFSVGIDGGYGYLSSPEEPYPNNYTNENDVYSSDTEIGDYVWGLHIGYDFKISPNTLFGFELGYKDLGRSLNNFSYKAQGHDYYWSMFSRENHQNAIDFLLTAHYFIYKGLNIFGKAGAAYVRSHVNQNVSSDTIIFVPLNAIPLDALTGDNSIWRLEPEMSIGVGYTFSNHFDIHTAYTHIGGAKDQPVIVHSSEENNAVYLPTAKVYSSNMIMLGISYTF